jgi:hypothetical protein
LPRLAGNGHDFRQRRVTRITHFPEKVKCGGFVERQADNAMRTGQCHVQGDPAAVRMTDKVHLPLGPIDQCYCSLGLIRQGEGTFAAPRSHLIRPIVLGCEQRVTGAEPLAELAPLPGA